LCKIEANAPIILLKVETIRARVRAAAPLGMNMVNARLPKAGPHAHSFRAGRARADGNRNFTMTL